MINNKQKVEIPTRGSTKQIKAKAPPLLYGVIFVVDFCK